MQALGRDVRHRWARGIVDTLRQDMPDSVAGLTEADIDVRLSIALDQAERYGLRDDRDLRAYVQLAICIGPRFDVYPPFAAQLAATARPPAARLRALFANASDDDWCRAAVADVVARASAGRSARPAMALAGLRLEPLDSGHAAAFFQLSSHPDVWRPAGLHPFATLADCAGAIAAANRPRAARRWAIIVPPHGFVGALSLLRDGDAWRLSYWVGRPWWNRGIATQALRQLPAAAGSGLVHADTCAENTPSQRLLARCGFALSPASAWPSTGCMRWMRGLPAEAIAA